MSETTAERLREIADNMDRAHCVGRTCTPETCDIAFLHELSLILSHDDCNPETCPSHRLREKKA